MKTKIITGSMIAVFSILLLINSCVSTRIAEKSGTELWGENCLRCHNTPPSSAFTNSQWETINTHMRVRAMLTDAEYNKILEFLQQGD